ncbi:forespore capture DNA-binding protein RefZ [Alkalibacillus sp. S2W]|uniref:forespore capture DNA-binding protein RefZ n=1 Tax=Alkalibacillus sp. S2W TaxID=3386553 RepID=UPI00398D2B82
MSKQSSREKIMNAAIELFYYNGFNGTSIRAITDQANVNVSLISYYFKNKQGLLEQATVDYYEYYLEMLESLIDEHPISTKDDFLNVIKEIIHYKEKHFQFTCFIQRELTLDNQFIRELFSTYVGKETYYFKTLVEKITERVKANKMEQEAFYLQFKSLINGPFIYGNEWKREYEWDDSRGVFIQSYINLLNQWFSPLLAE